MYRKLLALAAAPVAVIGIGLATAGAANAASTPCPASDGCVVFSNHLAGYSTIFTGNVSFNDVRSDLTPPSEPNGINLVDTVATGVVLQESAAGANDPTVGLGLVWNDTTHVNNSTVVCADGGSSTDQWTLEATQSGAVNVPAGSPVPPGMLTPIMGIGGVANQVFCVPSNTQRFYVEIHESTLGNCIGFDAGFLEPGDNVTPFFGGRQCMPLGDIGLFDGARFHEAGVGVDTTTGVPASDLQPGTTFGYWRDGLTQLLDPSKPAGATNSRLTLDHFNMREYLGTEDGTGSGTPSLTPSGLGVGSAFNVTANT